MYNKYYGHIEKNCGKIFSERNLLMRKEKNDMVNEKLRRATTELFVLSLLTQKDMYGYQMTQKLDEMSNGRCCYRESSFYTVLSSLQKKGYVSSYQTVTDDCRMRNYYHIEPQGIEYYTTIKKDALDFLDLIHEVLDIDGLQTKEG